MKKVLPKTPVFAVSDKQELNELLMNEGFKSSIAILIDFGIIVSQSDIDHFPDGIVNSHFSLLPEWRGADPITFAILSGQKQTGVSLMLLVEKMDEGPLLAQAAYRIPDGATTPELTRALIELSASTLKSVVPLYLSRKISPVSQDTGNIFGEKRPTYSRKLTKEDGVINWAKPAVRIEREIRAFIEWPKSHFSVGDKEIIVTQVKVTDDTGQPPGYLRVEPRRLYVYCGEGSLEIKKLKPAGKPEMTIEAFLAGYRHIL
jgi:methionyl-tRNA formyltransferase